MRSRSILMTLLFVFLIVSADGLASDSSRAIGLSGISNNPVHSVMAKPSSDSAGLFVGVNTFPEDSGLASLACAVNDAIAQAYLFVRELKLIPAENCYLCLFGEPTTTIAKAQFEQLEKSGIQRDRATKTRILIALKVATRLPVTRKDMIVVSFSTHGFETRDGVYLMPSDGVKAFLSDTAVYSNTVKGAITECEAGKKLLIIDACRERVTASRGTGSGELMTERFTRAFSAATGFATIMSCSVGQLSYEDGSSGHGIFTNLFLQALRGQAPADERGFITLGKVSEYVSQQTKDWFKRNRPGVPQRLIPTPSLAGAEVSRNIPLAIGANLSRDKINTLREGYLQGDFNPSIQESPLKDSRQRYLRILKELYLDGEIRIEDYKYVETLFGYDETLYDDLARRIADVYIQVAKGNLNPNRLTRMLDLIAHENRRKNVLNGLVPRKPGEIMTNSVGMKLVWIPPGEFMMGSPSSERDRDNDERQHRVRISKGFWMGQTEVTQGQWEAVMGYIHDKSRYQKRYLPLETASWHEAVEFCEMLNRKEGKTYRLPTEAEWEHACRAGTNTKFSFGDSDSSLGNYAWFRGNTWDVDRKYIQQVGQKKPNTFGLYDMHGNVWEWCSDWYDENYYSQSPSVDPQGPSSGMTRVLRGGGWNMLSGPCRSASRIGNKPDGQGLVGYGFRIVFQDF